MRILTATDQSLTLTTSAAGSIDYIVDWVDHSTTGGTPGSKQDNITTATTTEVCPAPASGVYRQITSINVSNRHATDSNIIKAFKTVGASSYAITDALTLAAGESVSCSQSGICYMSADPDLNISAHAAQTSGIHGLNGTTGKTLSWTRTMTLSGPTDGVTYTLPSATDTIMGQSGSYTPTGTWNWTSASVRWPSFDHLTMPNVKGYLTNTPPGTPANGDTYIIGAAPTGAWAGSAGKVAAWSSVASAWEIYTPENGWVFQSNSSREAYRYTSSAWEIYYQEGTWTPAITASTTAPTGTTYQYRGGRYTKLGNNVYLQFGFRLTATGTGGVGAVRISGMPFTSINQNSYQNASCRTSLVGGLTTPGNAPILSFIVLDNDTQMESRIVNNSDTTMPWSEITSSTFMLMEIYYNV